VNNTTTQKNVKKSTKNSSDEEDDENVCFTLIGDITEHKKQEEKANQYSKILEGVLSGIPDIIGVYKTDKTIMFYNQVGYDLLNKSPEKVIGKKCYEMLFRKRKCPNCQLEKAVETKAMVKLEKYSLRFDKYMDYCYNPVLNDSGEVIFVVERLRDITEKKNLENILKESEARYRRIVNLSPDAIIIVAEGKVVLANEEALKYFNNLIGESIYKHTPDFAETLHKRMNQILKNKISKTIFDYKVVLQDNSVIDIEVSSSYIVYNGKPGILSMMRDITERKRGLNAAARIQNQILPKTFPIEYKARMETLYIPSKTVSGDFFMVHKVNESLVVGIIGDVSGKGITAALNISAFNVLFHEAVLINQDPSEIIKKINEKIIDYCGERYVAACCYSFDFKNNEAKIVGAGINQFIYKNNNKYDERIVKGPFLGMFKNSVFDEQIIQFQLGDEFIFYSDGLEYIFDDEKMKEKLFEMTDIKEFKNYLNSSLIEKLSDIKGIEEDCTLVAFEMKKNYDILRNC